MDDYDDGQDDDGDDWRAIDSSDEEDDKQADNNNNNNNVERDDDVDIGFRSHQYGKQNNNKRSRTQNQEEEAIYGVFYDDNNNDGATSRRTRQRRSDNKNNITSSASAPPSFVPAAAPMFVPASVTRKKKSTTATKKATAASTTRADDDNFASMFVSATTKKETQTQMPPLNSTTAAEASSTTTAAAAAAVVGVTTAAAIHEDKENTTKSAAPEHDENINDVDVDVDDDNEDDDRIEKEKQKQEQQAADDHFLSLLEKAKARNKKTTRPSSSSRRPAQQQSQQQQQQLPPHPAMGMGGGLGLGSNANNSGIGMGLGMAASASSMGLPSSLVGKSTPSPQQLLKSSSETTTTASSKAAVPKGISRPVEVVVRPNNLGLGFNNFKEASQLKGNRRIEAEVRGIDYEEQLKKEKKEKRKTKNKNGRGGKQRYGEYHDNNDSDDDDDSSVEFSTTGRNKNNNSSAIPSTDELLSNRSWKARNYSSKSSNRNNKMKKKNVPEIIPYTELLERQKQNNTQPVIIDMRGPDYTKNNKSSSSTTTTGGGVELGEELLYNLSFLLNTYENKLHSSSRYEESIRKKMNSVDSDVRDLQQRTKEAQIRLEKLQKAYEITDRVKYTMNNNSLASDTKKKVKELVVELEETFTEEERETLQFWNVIAPTLLSPIVQTTLDKWRPFGVVGDSASDVRNKTNDNNRIVDSFFEWKSTSKAHQQRGDNKNNNKDDDDDSSRVLCKSMILNQLIPKLKSDLESSSQWDPIANTDVALDLYEYLQEKAALFDGTTRRRRKTTNDDNDYDDPNQIFPNEDNDGPPPSSSSSPSLVDEIRKELIFDAVYPKLQNAVLRWKPTFPTSPQQDSTMDCGENKNEITSTHFTTIEDPLNLWVLPWLPHLDHPALLPNLLTDCKRKIKGGLSFLQRKISNNNDRDFVVASIRLLRPWQNVFDVKSLQRMISEDNTSSVIPRLANLLSTMALSSIFIKHSKEEPQKYWQDIGLLFELHARKMISDADFLSVMEGPVLTNWARNVHGHLYDGLLSNSNSNETTTDTDHQQQQQQQEFITTAIDMYHQWKINILVDPSLCTISSSTKAPKSQSFSCDRSLLLLRGDQYVCRIYYSVLRMIQISQQLSTSSSLSSSSSSKKILEELEELEPGTSGFRSVAARRSLEQKKQLQEDFVKMESRSSVGETKARILLQRRNVGVEPTFRDVVEEFANDRGVFFQPKIGVNARKDGKQIFLFGTLPIYLQDDVVFCYNKKDSTWKPVSLDQIIGIAASN
ncbi:hypothetical protein FRACYDRAFT_252511 [Fragilariopsis cylindrus CCMP1102]|uniref:Tuftelin interacting protein N-terminal domain-containing protein n=1 Tax=Fragilariopsis cylindrus CCMP1102 TaxID=635003 RepID=A0A1E7ELW5_9STRA|nr:hypothetical protein FRACYDRAFT_252511 [Fragilariopsis cylindrus CCMP1102]|eukprot:OEU06881.1 hypothetical protein FRACYDRAFT_252511 [Fragilariopsis cylindrus CCMP1102]